MPIKFPRQVNLNKAGIHYTEEGPNVMFVNLVQMDDKIRLVFTIDQDEVGNMFSASTFGRIIDSIPLAQALESAKELEKQPLEE